MDPILATPLELIATKKTKIQCYADMCQLYPQLLKSLEKMQQDPRPYLTGLSQLIPGTHTQRAA